MNAAFLSSNVHQQDGSAWALHAWICQILASGRFGLFFFLDYFLRPDVRAGVRSGQCNWSLEVPDPVGAPAG